MSKLKALAAEPKLVSANTAPLGLGFVDGLERYAWPGTIIANKGSPAGSTACQMGLAWRSKEGIRRGLAYR